MKKERAAGAFRTKQKRPYQFILASASPQRTKLLRRAGISFLVFPSRVREMNPEKFHHKKTHLLVKELAYKKARCVADIFKNRNCIVLGSDTLVVCNGKIIGKPRNETDAGNILRTLSGRWQKVFTGVCLISNPDGNMQTNYAVTSLKFKKLDEKTISKLAKKNMDKSGAYAIQKMNDRYVKVIKGDLDNVIGLPVKLVKKMLTELARRRTLSPH